MAKNLKNIAGFTLIELSVVLTIIGITLAGALDLATRKTEADRITETNTRMDAIEKALQVYLINNQRLPCPADGTLLISHANFGLEVAGGGNRAAAPTCTLNNFSDASVRAGMVPTKTLQLADKYMTDDWDRRFTYVVDINFTNNYTTNTSCSGSACFKQATAGGITVNDSTATAITTEAVYVLISHGKNGSGAFKYIGGARLGASADTDEKENAGDDRTIATAGFNAIFVKKDTTTTFDDTVRYATKALLISSVSGVTESTTCTAAHDATLTPGTGTDPCVGATSTANCYALAARVNDLCLQP